MKITVNDATTEFDRGARRHRVQFNAGGEVLSQAVLNHCMTRSPSFVDGWIRCELHWARKLAVERGIK